MLCLAIKKRFSVYRASISQQVSRLTVSFLTPLSFEGSKDLYLQATIRRLVESSLAQRHVIRRQTVQGMSQALAVVQALLEEEVGGEAEVAAEDRG